MEDHYHTLGVRPDASQTEIKKRFRELAHSYHPDKYSTSGLQEYAEETFKRINEAYHVLSNQRSRAEYDRQRLAIIRQQDIVQRRAEEAVMARRRREDETRAASWHSERQPWRPAPAGDTEGWGFWQIAAIFCVSLVGPLVLFRIGLAIVEYSGVFVLCGIVALGVVLAVLFTQPWKIS